MDVANCGHERKEFKLSGPKTLVRWEAAHRKGYRVTTRIILGNGWVGPCKPVYVQLRFGIQLYLLNSLLWSMDSTFGLDSGCHSQGH